MAADVFLAPDIDERIGALENLLGDPRDPANPVGHAAILGADERAELLPAGEELLDEFGLKAEMVPAELGGRFTRADDLVELMRSLYRRDPCLGLGYASSTLLGAVNVWTAGSAGQRADLAELLLANGRVAAAYHELAHGNDIGAMEFSALPGPAGGLLLNGRKEVVSNLRRADAVVFFARTDPGPGRRSHSQVYVRKSDLDPRRYTYLPRFRSVGMRGVDLGGIEIRDCPIDAGSVLGPPGRGMEVTTRAYQLTRTALPAMCTALLDTGLRTALDHVRSRTLYGRTADTIPMVRTTLVNAFVDQLVCEALALAATRALHLAPRAGSVYAPAVKYLLSGLLLDAMQQLVLVMGSEFYRRDGVNAIFEKIARDLKPVGFGHVARAACLTSLIPQLPLLARRGWWAAEPAPDGLFAPIADLPPLDFAGLTITSGGHDPLAGSLATASDRLGPDAPATLRRLVERQAGELAMLTAQCAALAPADLSIVATARTRQLAAAYVTALAASACIELHLRHRATSGFLGGSDWLVAALTRLSAAHLPVTRDVPVEVEDALLTELRRRHDQGAGFGISARQLR
ncbi:acyl-CoA dehydrogenase [Micromonospora sp. RL09-050-HVF-A]|uniref:acyl-CoA dehydrogenase n=1 Tax=unclassified Micromonospora TaxID=2617518 RepID=UPI001C5E5785|nr:acyl-CoA dehydrogenase [Micromonospora sp. RL09-050-HVF-A]MBW4702063.1 acyl-CoA dehydrogenase [Micromonospora sp. RL09-050-HVF-A]